MRRFRNASKFLNTCLKRDPHKSDQDKNKFKIKIKIKNGNSENRPSWGPHVLNVTACNLSNPDDFCKNILNLEKPGIPKIMCYRNISAVPKFHPPKYFSTSDPGPTNSGQNQFVILNDARLNMPCSGQVDPIWVKNVTSGYFEVTKIRGGRHYWLGKMLTLKKSQFWNRLKILKSAFFFGHLPCI